jgi:hypothetical protein
MLRILGLLLSLTIGMQLNSCAYQRQAFGQCAFRVKTAECYGQTTQDTNLIASSYTAADRLLQSITPFGEPFEERRFLITTIADLDDLEESTALGRLISEQLAVRFAQRGYTVLEPKLGHYLMLRTHTGELVLSRETRDFLLTQQVNTVVTGTYAIGKDTVYITLKMLDAKESQVIASYAYTLPIGPNTYALLQKFWWW